MRGERKSIARRVRDIYSKLKMTYDYSCLVRQARRSPNSGGQTPRQCKFTKLPWHADTDPCAPPWTSFFERDQQSTCRRNSRDVARQTAPGIHLPHTLSYIALLINTGTSFPDQLTAVTVPLCIMPRSIIDHRAVDRGRRVNPVALDEAPARIPSQHCAYGEAVVDKQPLTSTLMMENEDGRET